MLAPHAPCPTPFNMTAHVLARADGLTDKLALQILHSEGSDDWRYGRLQRAVLGAGTGLLALGLQRGDRILMRLGNSPAFPVLYLAAIAVGLIPVPTAAALTVAEITPMATRLAPRLIVAELGVALPDIVCPVLLAQDVLAMQHLPPCVYDYGDANRLAYVVFTSGTSGSPMPVAHAHRAVWARQMMHRDWQGLMPADRLLHAGALSWTYTLGTGLLDPWTVGATALILGAGLGAADVPQLLHHHQATIFAATPGVYRQLLRQPLPHLPHLRHGLTAGEAMTPQLSAQWQAATATLVHPALGLSECNTFISGSPQRPAPAGSAGYAQSGRNIAVLDSEGVELPPDQPGTLAVHRDDPGLMLGYLDLPDATAARFIGAWFVTGDQVSRSADGAINYLGRDDDQMNPGGFRVSPLEVEAVMAQFSGVTDCAVITRQVQPGVQIIVCYYTADAALDETVLADFADRQLARYKQPRQFIWLDALPRNANNKVNRAALRRR